MFSPNTSSNLRTFKDYKKILSRHDRNKGTRRNYGAFLRLTIHYTKGLTKENRDLQKLYLKE